MFTKDNDISITIKVCFKKMSFEKRNFFTHSSNSSDKFPAPKLTNFYVFIIHLSLNLTLFSKSPYLTADIKINYETGCMGRFSEKTQIYI